MSENIRESGSFTVWLHRVLDATIPFLTLYAIVYLYGIRWGNKYETLGVLGGLILLITNQSLGVYSQWRGRTLFAGIKLVTQSWFITWLVLLAIAFSVKESEAFSRVVVTSWAISLPFLLFLYRFIYRFALGSLHARGWQVIRVAIIGGGDLGQRLAKTLSEARMLGYKPIAFYDDDPTKLNQFVAGVPVAGTIDDFLDKSHYSDDFDEIYITLPLRSEGRIQQVLNGLADSTVVVKFIPDLFAFDLLHSRMTDIGGIPIISVYDSPLNNLTNKFFKRLEDFVLSFLILILISPAMLAIALAVKFTSAGPVIFKQKRYGLNGKEIWVWKFRSMKVLEKEGPIQQARKNDPRITRLGSFLRRTSLDELPQFLNVLAGRMSIVGPRPHVKSQNEEYRKLIQKYMLRHTVKPGITGWAQINGLRGETDTLDKMEKRVQFDLYYIDNWSVWMDLKIILLTIIKGFINKNAY